MNLENIELLHTLYTKAVTQPVDKQALEAFNQAMQDVWTRLYAELRESRKQLNMKAGETVLLTGMTPASMNGVWTRATPDINRVKYAQSWKDGRRRLRWKLELNGGEITWRFDNSKVAKQFLKEEAYRRKISREAFKLIRYIAVKKVMKQ